MNIEDERRKFEDYIIESGPTFKDEKTGEYLFPQVAYAWQAWQARASDQPAPIKSEPTYRASPLQSLKPLRKPEK